MAIKFNLMVKFPWDRFLKAENLPGRVHLAKIPLAKVQEIKVPADRGEIQVIKQLKTL